MKTQACIDEFQRFPIRILCSARPVSDLLEKMENLGIKVDWIVGCSGSIVADGSGKRLWQIPLDLEDVLHLEQLNPEFRRIEMEGEILQLAVSAEFLPKLSGLRIEVYQGIAFISHWEASKFRAIHRLLRHLNWTGRVAAFGDGPYDLELLTYFDGREAFAKTSALSRLN